MFSVGTYEIRFCSLPAICPETTTGLSSGMTGDFHIFCQINKSLRKLIMYSSSIIVWSVLYYEKKDTYN